MAKILTQAPAGHPAHALIDFEGLGGDKPVILGFGVAVFGYSCLSPGGLAEPWAAPLFSAWPITTREQDDRTSDHETIGWWLMQDACVREAVSRALGHGSRAGLLTLTTAIRQAWQAASAAHVHRWWAKPASFDLWLWRYLVREHVGAEVVGKTRDARTLWEAAECVKPMIKICEPPRDLVGPLHDPGADALASAAACADAIAILRSVGA